LPLHISGIKLPLYCGVPAAASIAIVQLLPFIFTPTPAVPVLSGGPLDLQGLILGIIADGDGRGRSDNDLVAHILDLQSCYRQALYPAFCRFHDSSDYIILFPCEMNNDGDIIPKIAKEVISCRDEENLT